jgi:Protein of unknown function (DUF2795)
MTTANKDDHQQTETASDAGVGPEAEVRMGSPISGASEEERAVRKELINQIVGASFPATRNDLLRHVGPDDRGPIEARLRMLPPDHRFASPEDVVAALGGMSTT